MTGFSDLNRLTRHANPAKTFHQCWEKADPYLVVLSLCVPKYLSLNARLDVTTIEPKEIFRREFSNTSGHLDKEIVGNLVFWASSCRENPQRFRPLGNSLD